MRSKKSKFIKQFFFILILFFNKSYTRECIDITSNVNQKLAIQALASQSYLNNLVIRFDESKKKYIDTVGEMKSLTDAIEVGLVDLSKDVQQAVKTERSLIRTASGILEYQYSLNEQAASVVDFLLSAPVKQKQIPLDLDFLDDKAKDEVRATINKYNIAFKEGFNPVSEYYTNEIDELLGYVPGDPYGTKAAFIASKLFSLFGNAYSTCWHPSGNYVVITGDYFGSGPGLGPQLIIYSFDGTSLSNFAAFITYTFGTYRSIDWSPGGEYLVAGGSRNVGGGSDGYCIRVFKFDEVILPSVMQVATAQYDTSGFDVTSVAWHPDFNDTSGGYFAAVGNGDNIVDEIQIYQINLPISVPPIVLNPVYSTNWGTGVNKVYSCSWSPDGEYLAVAGQRNNLNQVLQVFKFDSDLGKLEEPPIPMYYDDFYFDVDWFTGVDWSPNGQYLALSSNFLLPANEGESPQITMNAVGNAFAVWKSISNVIQALRYDVAIDMWQEEAVALSSSACSETQVAINNNGDAIAVWKRDDGGGSSTIQANRYDAGTGFWQPASAVTNLSLSDQNASLPQVVMNDEYAIVVWQRPTGSETIIQANRYNGSSWQGPGDVTNLSALDEESIKPQIAMNDEGDAVVVWRSFDGGDDYAIQASKYDHKSCDWLSVDTIFSGTFPTIDNPQVAMSNAIAIIVWEGKETYDSSYNYSGKYHIVQARVNLILKGWEQQDAWEPSLNKEPEDLSLDSRNPQIAICDYEGIAVWEHIFPSPPIPPLGPDQVIQAKKYILGQGWQQSTENISKDFVDSPPWLPLFSPQIAMDGAGNAIVVWWSPVIYLFPEYLGGVAVNRYNAVTDSWEGPRFISEILKVQLSQTATQIAMDRAGNTIVIWREFPRLPPVIYASRYSEATGLWDINLGDRVGRYSLKIVRFDDSPEALTFFMAWNKIQSNPSSLGDTGIGVTTAKWAPSRDVVAIGSSLVSINGIYYRLIIFEVDFLSEILTPVEGVSSLFKPSYKAPRLPPYYDLAWRPDNKYLSVATAIRSLSPSSGQLRIYGLDQDYFTAVIDTYDTSLPTKQEMKWPNKGESDVGILSNILCQNQLKTCTKNIPTKFAIPGDYTGAAGFVDIINPACISADYGLTAVLDASVEVTNSLLGARKRNYKFMQDNLKLSKRLTDVYKKSIEIKKTEQARVIDQPGVYTFNKDVQGVIVIDADNITLDLNGYKIFSDSKIPITVNKNIKNISIKNGFIIGGNQYLGAPSGVLVQEGAQHITLENLTITFCYEGVTFKGEQDCSVTDCLVQDCAFKSNIKAASLDCSEYVTFKECEFLDCFLETVNLENNNKNCCQ